MTSSSPAPPSPKTSNKSWIISGILILVLVILTALFVDVQEMIQVMRSTNPLLVLAGIFFLLLGIALIDFRWWYLLSRRPGFRRTMHATHTSYIVPILTPIPNYISRVIITATATEASLPQSTTAMLVERMIAQIMRISTIVLAISLGVQSELSTTSMIRSVGISFAVLLAYLIAIRYAEAVTRGVANILTAIKLKPGWVEKITAMVHDALSTDVGMKELILAVAVTIIMWTFFFLFHFLVILAMPLGLSLHSQVTIALGALALTPPSAPAMLGIYQISQIGPNLILRLGEFDDLLPYSLMLYFLQLIVWTLLTLWGLHALKMKFIDLFRLRNINMVSDAESAPSTDQL